MDFGRPKRVLWIPFETGTPSVDEGAGAAYTVVLDTKPTDDVTVTPQVRDASDAEISVSEALTFTMDDWHIPQTVTVTAAADDNRAHGSATISRTVAGGDYEANGVTAESVEVAEVDAEGRTVVTLVQVPDGTVIPDNSTLTVGGETVLAHQTPLAPARTTPIMSSLGRNVETVDVVAELGPEGEPVPASIQSAESPAVVVTTIGAAMEAAHHDLAGAYDRIFGHPQGQIPPEPIPGIEATGC